RGHPVSEDFCFMCIEDITYARLRHRQAPKEMINIALRWPLSFERRTRAATLARHVPHTIATQARTAARRATSGRAFERVPALCLASSVDRAPPTDCARRRVRAAAVARPLRRDRQLHPSAARRSAIARARAVAARRVAPDAAGPRARGTGPRHH